jgi:hypothetical protein
LPRLTKQRGLLGEPRQNLSPFLEQCALKRPIIGDRFLRQTFSLQKPVPFGGTGTLRTQCAYAPRTSVQVEKHQLIKQKMNTESLLYSN